VPPDMHISFYIMTTQIIFCDKCRSWSSS